jgi:hypothetical protein
MVELAGQYDAGLVGETGGTLNRRIALTNKQFIYILAGIPVVLSDIPAHVNFAKEAGPAARLYQVENPVSLARVLDELFTQSELASARIAAHQLGQSALNWEAEAPLLLECVATALRNSGASDSKRSAR